MSKYAVEYLTTNRRGELEDREVVVRAGSKVEAEQIAKARFPKAAGHTAHLVEGR